MRKILPIFLLFLSCKNHETKTVALEKTEVEFGKELFEGKGNCASCHLVDQKVIGPSIQEIASTYKTQNTSIIDFLKNDAKPIIDPSQYEVMKTNFAITKAMTDKELQSIEAYIYANEKL